MSRTKQPVNPTPAATTESSAAAPRPGKAFLVATSLLVVLWIAFLLAMALL